MSEIFDVMLFQVHNFPSNLVFILLVLFFMMTLLDIMSNI